MCMKENPKAVASTAAAAAVTGETSMRKSLKQEYQSLVIITSFKYIHKAAAAAK